MYTRAITSFFTAVSIGKKPGIGLGLSPMLSLNRGGRVGSLRLSASLIQALHTPILSPSIARAIWNHRSLQRLHVSIHSACSILLNFLIRSQSTAETGSGVAVVGVGIGASSGKDAFGPSGVPLLLHGASSVVYSGGVGEWVSP